MTATIERVFTSYAAAPAATVDAENPWPGLESFREQDVAFFRGRDREAHELLAYVQRERLTVLYGLSGLGKSSLLQAGLFPLARAEGLFPVYIRLAYEERASSLRQQVLDRIREEAAAHQIDAPKSNPSETLWEHFHREDQAYWTADNRPLVPLLVFDQFEEAFTLGSSTPERKRHTDAFLQELGDLIEGRPPSNVRASLAAGEIDRAAFAFNRHSYKILIGIRQDFLAELETLRTRVPSVMVNRMPLTPLRGDAALLVTAAGGPRLVPTTSDGTSVGEQIVRRLAGDVDEQRDAALESLVVDPALLSLFCRELNERRKALRRDSITADLLEGSREQILDDYYQRSIADLGLPVRKLVEDQLLTVGGHRNSEALENALARPGVTAAAIDTLIARRILRREDRDRRTRLELTHDVLTGVVKQSRDRRWAEEAAEAQTREERARAEQLERNASRARRLNIAMSAAGALFLALALYSVRESRQAKAALAAYGVTNAAREREHREHDSVVAVKNSVVAAKNKQLQETIDAMTRVQDSVRFQQSKAIVASEIAERYLQMSAQAIYRRVAADSALSATVKREIARADSIREDARKISEVNQRRWTVVDSLICLPPANLRRSAADTAFLGRLRSEINQKLTAAKISDETSCVASNSSPRRGAP